MKVLFVIDTGRPGMVQEPLGMMHISALLKQHGHECEAIDLAVEEDLITTVCEHNPQLLAFSAITGPHRKLVQASQEIKEGPDIWSVFGGPHPTYFPQMIEEDGVDIICRGEGEYPMLELVEALEAGKDFTSIQNLWVKHKGQIYRNPLRPFVQDLDSLPWPDREIFNRFDKLHIDDTRHFMGGRGCPYNCAFCFNHIAKKLAKGRYVRWRSVDDFIEELKTVKEQYNMRFVNFQDDTFVLSIDWLEEFSLRYRQELGIPFLCNVRADLITDHLSQVLADAGCVCAAVGLESGNDYIRNTVLNKHITREQFISACNSLKAQGIRIITQNIFGLPFETVDAALDTISLNIACGTDQINTYFYVPYPGTQLAELAVREGIFQAESPNFLPESFSTAFSSVNLTLPKAKQIERLAWLAPTCVHFPILFPFVRWAFTCSEGKLTRIQTAITLFVLFLQRRCVTGFSVESHSVNASSSTHRG
jgi:radical SAM superfamily enzyme YgiQ (UPF0313 family)